MKRNLIILGIIATAAVAGAVQYFSSRTPEPAPESAVENTLAEESATTSLEVREVTTNNSARPAQRTPVIAAGDTIASWDFQGVYAGNPELTAKAISEVVRLTNLLGKGTYTDMALFVGIANQYSLIGNGKQTYDYLGRAIEAGGTTSGLPWHNLGVLMQKLGALQTARAAYETATLVQPEMKIYHLSYIEFLTGYMKNETALIEKEFAAALASFNQDEELLRLRSEWQNS